MTTTLEQIREVVRRLDLPHSSSMCEGAAEIRDAATWRMLHGDVDIVDCLIAMSTLEEYLVAYQAASWWVEAFEDALPPDRFEELYAMARMAADE